MGKTRDLFKKIRHTKGTFHAKMGLIKDRNSMDLTESESEVAQSSPTLCNPRDCSLPGSKVPLSPWNFPGKNTGVGCHFLLQCMKVKVKSLSRVRPSSTPWTAAFQAPPSMGFSRQEYWSGVPLPSPNSIYSHCQK